MKYLNYLHFGLTVLIGIVVVFGLGQAPAPLGGVTNFDQLDAANPPSGGSAYSVSSTAVINASGQYVGGILSAIASTFSGTVTHSGLVNVAGERWGTTRTVATSTAGNNITATDICTGGQLSVNYDTGAYTSTTFPTAASMIAVTGCLDTIGATREVLIFNNSSASTSPFVVSGTYATGTLAVYSSSTSLVAGDYALVRAVTASSTGVRLYITAPFR